MNNPPTITAAPQLNRAASGRLRSSVSRGDKLRRLLWSAVQGTLFRYSFHTWSRWRVLLLRAFGARVQWPCIIRRTCRIYYPWLLQTGELVVIGDRAEIYNLGMVTLGDRVMVSQEAYVCAGTHDYTRLDLPLVTRPVTIEADAWICARAFIAPGVTVGAGAVVGAAAVVTKDVEPWTVVAGNPAAFVKKRQLQADAPGA